MGKVTKRSKRPKRRKKATAKGSRNGQGHQNKGNSVPNGPLSTSHPPYVPKPSTEQYACLVIIYILLQGLLEPFSSDLEQNVTRIENLKESNKEFSEAKLQILTGIKDGIQTQQLFIKEAVAILNKSIINNQENIKNFVDHAMLFKEIGKLYQLVTKVRQQRFTYTKLRVQWDKQISGLEAKHPQKKHAFVNQTIIEAIALIGQCVALYKSRPIIPIIGIENIRQQIETLETIYRCFKKLDIIAINDFHINELRDLYKQIKHQISEQLQLVASIKQHLESRIITSTALTEYYHQLNNYIKKYTELTNFIANTNKRVVAKIRQVTISVCTNINAAHCLKKLFEHYEQLTSSSLWNLLNLSETQFDLLYKKQWSELIALKVKCSSSIKGFRSAIIVKEQSQPSLPSLLKLDETQELLELLQQQLTQLSLLKKKIHKPKLPASVQKVMPHEKEANIEEAHEKEANIEEAVVNPLQHSEEKLLDRKAIETRIAKILDRNHTFRDIQAAENILYQLENIQLVVNQILYSPLSSNMKLVTQMTSSLLISLAAIPEYFRYALLIVQWRMHKQISQLQCNIQRWDAMLIKLDEADKPRSWDVEIVERIKKLPFHALSPGKAKSCLAAIKKHSLFVESHLTHPINTANGLTLETSSINEHQASICF